MYYIFSSSWIFLYFIYLCEARKEIGRIKPPKFNMTNMKYSINPAPDGHRCGVCPTYFQKICAFDMSSNATYIFDNHCVMDMYNCIEGTEFVPMRYDKCLYFGNFGYVHGYKYEDEDYGEDHVVIKNSKKNPDFVS